MIVDWDIWDTQDDGKDLVSYTPWVKVFVVMPVTTISGERVWCRRIYTRTLKRAGSRTEVTWSNTSYTQPTVKWLPPTETQYATDFDILKEDYGV